MKYGGERDSSGALDVVKKIIKQGKEIRDNGI